jgi:inner membrane protein
VENITHSLVGATLAELVLPASASPAQRRLYFVAGIIAANLPDADLLYSRITPPPLGYLLHHRGHTHTIAGLVGQAMLIALVALVPAVRRHIGASRQRFGLLIGAALLSHILLDSWNSYGVHPFWPVDNRWIYGDAIFIAEPWIWVLLGVAVTMNAHSRVVRGVVGALLVVLTSAVTWFGVIGGASFAALAIVGTASALAMRPMAPRRRSSVAMMATAAFVITMFAARHDIEKRALATLVRSPNAEVIDVVLSPQPANPLCWSALAVVKDERAGEYVMTGATVPLRSVVRCGSGERGRVVWASPVRQSLTTLRQLVRDDCRARAWMQFGRAPAVLDGQIADTRFGRAARGNFTSMVHATPSQVCPAHLTSWGMPRADLLE